MDQRPSQPSRLALVLSGGGARGAYEAGVLSYLLDDMAERLGRPVRFDIITGCSVGAIHACYLASVAGERGAADRLLNIWRSLSFEKVFPVGIRELVGVPWKLVGASAVRALLPARGRVPERLPGMFDTAALEDLVLDQVDWPKVRRNIDAGALQSLALATTEIATGRSVVFVDGEGSDNERWAKDPFVVARSVKIDIEHALASAAIPLLFPAVRIRGAYYCDGGLRLNTPLSPALRLGAERVVIIGLRHRTTPEQDDRVARRRETQYGNFVYLAGKALNALLLDRVDADVDRLRLLNRLLERGVHEYGAEFLDRINEPIVAARGLPYRVVPEVYVRPSRDLGAIAADCMRHQHGRETVRAWLSRNIARYASRGGIAEADLLSYIYFDRCYAEHLIELGRADAEAMADELAAFL